VSANSPARWKSAFLTLPDAAFFDILRNYLGDVKSPFNKHNLLEGMEAFLRRPDTRRSILALVDERDARLLTAVYLLDAPTHEELHRFFDGELGYLDLHHHLLNLQDRLLVYADRSGGDEEILLNPLLEEDLLASAVDASLLVRSRKAEPTDLPRPWISDSLLIALLSVLLEEGDFLKSDGGIRKKTETEIRKRLPILFPDEEGTRFGLLFSALRTAGLLRRGEGGHGIDLDAWRDFAALDELARSCLLVRCSRESDVLKAWREAEFLAGFLPTLAKDRAYGKDALVKLARLVAHRAAPDLVVREDWIDALEAWDAVARTEDGSWLPNPRFPSRNRGASDEAGIILQPNFDIAAKPDLSLREGLVLAAAAHLRRYDTLSQYELSKESFAQALSLGFHGREVSRELERLSAHATPQNVSFSLDVWEREYGSLALFEGVVIAADEDRMHLIEHLEELRKFIRLRLAPGIYLTDRSSLPECRRILKAAGIDLFPPVRRSEEFAPGGGFPDSVGGTDEGGRELQQTLFDPPEPVHTEPARPRGSILHPRGFSPMKPAGGPGVRERNDPEGRDDAERFIGAEKLMKELERLLDEAAFPEDQDREIRERIRKKLVLVREQLRPDSGRKEKSEAKGLDYVGKVLVIEQTLKNPSNYLEIILRAQDGAPTRVFARPRELKKTGTDLILVAATIPEDRPLEIPVKKISLVRRLRGFLMG